MQFDYHADNVLEDELVRLSSMTNGHVDALSKISNDPVIWEYLMEDGMTYEAIRDYVHAAIEEREKLVAYPFVVWNKATQEIAGTTRLYELNTSLRNIKVGHTWYGKAHRGSGVNQAAKFLLFEFLFDQLNMERIGFGVHELNARSRAALRKVGATQEGVLRQFLPDTCGMANNRRYDIILFSLLKAEWNNHEKSTLKSEVLA